MPYIRERKVLVFYYNMNILKEGGINKAVRAVEINLSEEVFGIILGKPAKDLICSSMQVFY